MAKYIVGSFGGLPLKVSWLPRLVDRYLSKGLVPTNLEILACDLGIGKNMAKSLRAWARAAGILTDSSHLTDIARHLLVDADPFLERPESIAFLHWQIASSTLSATASSWMFNQLLDRQFTIAQATTEFKRYLLSDNIKYAEATLRGDVEPLVRMHTQNSGIGREQNEDRFFAQLGLLQCITDGRQRHYSRTWLDERPYISDRLVRHAILSSLAKRKTTSSTLSSQYFIHGSLCCPGAIFGLTRQGFFDSVDRISRASNSGLNLSVMPGDEALLTATGSLAGVCVDGNCDVIAAQFFDSL